jgi:hypothetical protein
VSRPESQHGPRQAWRPSNASSYAYLLGIYLGDGCLTEYPRTFALDIVLDGQYPAIVAECVRAISSTAPANIARRAGKDGRWVRLVSYWNNWPSVFPQHGPGKKHERHIALEPWQRTIVDLHPCEFLRGLIHSDGSRSVNRFTVKLADGLREYAYPRYFFSNLSSDLRGLFCASCDQLGIRWTQSNHRNISVAYRPSVGLLDSFVGPKQ